jgi:hypothetical protein
MRFKNTIVGCGVRYLNDFTARVEEFRDKYGRSRILEGGRDSVPKWNSNSAVW